MAQYLARYAFRIVAVHDGKAGLAIAAERAFDLIVLDVMLPAMDGFDVLRNIRKSTTTPVIMLTARASPSDRVKGLELGADDYLPKPFAPEELLARIRAVLRRTGNAGSIEPKHDVISICASNQKVFSCSHETTVDIRCHVRLEFATGNPTF